MNKLFALLFIFLFAICSYAQTVTTNTSISSSSGETKSAEVSKTSQPAKSTDKFNLPPEKLNPVRITKFSTAPVIDGKLDEEVWKSSQVLKDFYQTFPGDNIPASKPTEVMLGYDERYLYIGFKCYDERDKIRA